MWKKRIKQALFILAGLFICLNIFLLIYHEESIYKRKAYIGEWSLLPELDLKESVIEEGTYLAAEKAIVSPSLSQDSFFQTMVEEKEEVEEGETLIEYQPLHYTETEQELEAQLKQLTAEIAAVESTLDQLATEEPLTEPNDFSPEVEEEGMEEEDTEQEEVEMEEEDSSAYLREQFRLEKEEELAGLLARETLVEEQLEQLTEEQDFYVASPIDGIIETIEEKEDGPVITVVSDDLVIEGIITEELRKKLDTGMDVKISGLEAEGTITSLADQPEIVTETESTYTFQVSIREQAEDEITGTSEILPGYHTTMEIILDERLNVPAVHEEQLTATLVPAVWVLEADGTISYQKLETGMEEGKWIEIESGAETGQLVAESPGNFTEGAIFVTPLYIELIEWKRFNQKDNSLIKRYPLLAGLLHH